MNRDPIEATRPRRHQRSAVDFHTIEDKHIRIHDRLVNWARWNGASNRAEVSPMFSGAKDDDHWEGAPATMPVDEIDAQFMEKAVYHLPPDHRKAIRWSYVYRTAPAAQAKEQGLSLEGLQRMVRDGRQMLMNRLD